MKQEKELPTSPDWSTAPDWAQWFAVDRDGVGFFYKEKPYQHFNFWCNNCTILPFKIGYFNSSDWPNSLQKRPE